MIALNKTKFVLNMTGFVLYKTKCDADDDEDYESNGIA